MSIEASTGSRGMSGHQRAYRGKSDTWLTPPSIVRALGPFDLDPCCPIGMPWNTARQMLTPEADGLASEWHGRVWLNPPYGPATGKWLAKLADHGNGIALIFARTETADFHRHVWQRADAALFLKGRLHFHDVEGNRAPFNAGAPSVLIAYGADNAKRLRTCGIDGKFVRWSSAALASLTGEKWVDVRERLPGKEVGHVLVSRSLPYDPQFGDRDVTMATHAYGDWRSDHGSVEGDGVRVTHWRPLPDPAAALAASTTASPERSELGLKLEQRLRRLPDLLAERDASTTASTTSEGGK